MKFIQVILISGQKIKTRVCNLSLNTHNFPCVNIDSIQVVDSEYGL